MEETRPDRVPVRGLLIAMILLAGAGSLLRAIDWDTPDEKWRNGPVKYLLTSEERKQYKKLKTDEERAGFVSQFWLERDPTPNTPENEYRTEFYRRAKEAAARFTEDGGKGWQDDRGKIFILLGEPDEIAEGTSLLDLGATAGAGSPDRPTSGGAYGDSSAGEVRPDTSTKSIKFIYNQNPLEPGEERLELDFTAEVTGEYRLRQRLDWDTPLLRGFVSTPPAAPVASAPETGGEPAMDDTAPAGEAPTGQQEIITMEPKPEPTPQSELLHLVREQADLELGLPMDLTANFYMAGDQSTFATLTLEIPRSALPAASDPDAVIVSAEFSEAETGKSVQRFFKPSDFSPYEGNVSAGMKDTLLYQAERPFQPGSYKALFAAKDPASGAIGKLEKDLRVPSFQTEGVTLSTVTLARDVAPLAVPPEGEGVKPFILGSFTVVPRPDNVYKQGEDLTFYYQIYGAGEDATTGKHSVDLSYAFEKDIKGTWKMVGGKPLVTPAQERLVHAFSLPLKGWPPGSYRISIDITDKTTGGKAHAEIPFSIQSAGASKAKSK